MVTISVKSRRHEKTSDKSPRASVRRIVGNESCPRVAARGVAIMVLLRRLRCMIVFRHVKLPRAIYVAAAANPRAAADAS
mmetsp:Transcript_144717/g.462722  ORF Transcript_144717/g.462722 Transcript_144717/m.462722 type:complete len:80 (-) Transcript_144717:208-447(-)